MIKIVIIIGFIIFVGSATVVRPEFLAENEFLNDFVGGDLLNVLGVILTITLASIVHVHSEISRMTNRLFRGRPDAGRLAAANIRSELNSSAHALIWIFVSAVIALILKSEMKTNMFWLSAMNGVGAGLLLTMVLIMYDIHRAIFALASAGPVETDD